MPGINMQNGEGEFYWAIAKLKGFASQVKHHNRIFTAREQHGRVCALRYHFANDVDRLSF